VLKAGKVLAAALSLAMAAAAAAGARQPAGANPGNGTVADRVFSNPYFGFRYLLPVGWTAGPQPPPGRVLDEPEAEKRGRDPKDIVILLDRLREIGALDDRTARRVAAAGNDLA
jgi:hypothetical protein